MNSAVQTCTCQHTEGDHLRARSSFPHPAQHGRCMVPGCACERFTDEDARGEACFWHYPNPSVTCSACGYPR